MDDVEALSTIVAVLKQLEPDAQRRVLQSVHMFLGHEIGGRKGINVTEIQSNDVPNSMAGTFSRDRTLSAKEFMRDKHPVTDVERVTCLAYYLAHYQDKPHFKTLDISTLNTEAAQPKFANASWAVDNAAKLGYLVAATKGNKQISVLGEKFVELLPDREAAREAVRSYRPRKAGKSSKKNKLLV